MSMVKTPRNTAQPSRPAVEEQGDSWTEFANLYPLYVALAQQCDLGTPPYPQGSALTRWPDRKTMGRDLEWLQSVDARTQTVHLRQLLATPLAAKEKSLCAFLHRQLSKPVHGTEDRDKIDLLVVQYFVLCATPELIASDLGVAAFAKVLRPVLGEIEIASLPCCQPLDQILTEAELCNTLHEFIERGLIDQGRIVKQSAGETFYDPLALIYFCRFNFLFRRIFIRVVHGDLRSIGNALSELERRAIKTVDCRNAGLTESESIAKLRDFHLRWKLPFQRDYTQPGSFRFLDQLSTLRSDLESALIGGSAEGNSEQEFAVPIVSETPVKRPTPPAPPAAPPATRPASQNAGPAKTPAGTRPAAKKPTNTPAAPPPAAEPALPTLSADDCEEKIWELLIATPPVRGRSMSTITIENTRVLLSAWEVAAFVSDSGPDSEEIRRAMVARTLLAIAVERQKQHMDAKVLDQALAVARDGIPKFQEHIEQLKRGSKVEGAVNLGITLKRLLSIVEDAEQLRRNASSEAKR
jgi:hypothetical protein